MAAMGREHPLTAGVRLMDAAEQLLFDIRW
jgi:hypothetical protein